MKYLSVNVIEYVQKLYAAKQNLMRTVRGDINEGYSIFMVGRVDTVKMPILLQYSIDSM